MVDRRTQCDGNKETTTRKYGERSFGLLLANDIVLMISKSRSDGTQHSNVGISKKEFGRSSRYHSKTGPHSAYRIKK